MLDNLNIANLEEILHEQLMAGFSWEDVQKQKDIDQERSKEFKEPWGGGTPNQYTLPDGRIVDAELCLYDPVLRDETDG